MKIFFSKIKNKEKEVKETRCPYIKSCKANNPGNIAYERQQESPQSF